MEHPVAAPPGVSAMSSTLPPGPQRHASTSSAASGSSRGVPSVGGKHRWTDAETQALVDGCNKHGVGQWKKILDDPDLRGQFDHRSAGDLKDRFRTYFPDAYRELYPNAKTHHGHSTRSRNAQGKSIFVRGLCRPKRAFSAEETQALYDGWKQYGSHWSKIARLPPFEGKRTPTDLRDRFRNAFPHEYEQAGFKARTRERRRRAARSEAHPASADAEAEADAAADPAAESMHLAPTMASSYSDSAGWVSSSSVSGASVNSDWAALSDASAGQLPPFSALESRATTAALQALSLNQPLLPGLGLSEPESAGAEWFSAQSDAAASASSGHTGTGTSTSSGQGRSSGSSRRRRVHARPAFAPGDAPPQGGFPWLSEMQMQIAMQLQAQLLDSYEDGAEEERHSGDEEDDEYDSEGEEEDWPTAPHAHAPAHAPRTRTLTMQPSGRLRQAPTVDNTSLERSDTFLPSVPTVVQPSSPQRRPILEPSDTQRQSAPADGASWSTMRMDETMLDFFTRMAAEMGMTPTQFAATWADAHPTEDMDLPVPLGQDDDLNDLDGLDGSLAQESNPPSQAQSQSQEQSRSQEQTQEGDLSPPFAWSPNSQQPAGQPLSGAHPQLYPTLPANPDPSAYPDASLLAWLNNTSAGLAPTLPHSLPLGHAPAGLGAAQMASADSTSHSSVSSLSRPPSRGPALGMSDTPDWMAQVQQAWDTQVQAQTYPHPPPQPEPGGPPASSHPSPLNYSSPYANSPFSSAASASASAHLSPPPPAASSAPAAPPAQNAQMAAVAAAQAQAQAQAQTQAQAAQGPGPDPRPNQADGTALDLSGGWPAAITGHPLWAPFEPHPPG